MLDVETDAYIHCVSAFVKLAQSEYQLLVEVIPEHHQKKTFDSLIQVLPCPGVQRPQQSSLQKLELGPCLLSVPLEHSHLLHPVSWGSVLGGVPMGTSPSEACWLPPHPHRPREPALTTRPLPELCASLSQDALDGLMLEGENIVSAARKAIVRHDFSAVLTIFPILRHLKQTKPEFDQVLQVCGWGGLGDAGRRILPLGVVL